MDAFVILGQPTCKYCDEAKKFLAIKEEGYLYIDLTKDRWAMSLLLKAGLRSVPQVFAPNGTHIGGYEDLKKYFGSNWAVEDSGVDQHD